MFTIDEKVINIAIPVLSFLGGMTVNAYSMLKGIATRKYVDRQILDTHKLIDEKTNNCLKDCIQHSDNNRVAMFNALNNALIEVKTLGAKQDMILELIRQLKLHEIKR